MFVPISYCWCAEACWFGLVYGRFHQPVPHLSAHTEPGLGWAALLESCRDSHTSLFIHLKMYRALAVLPFYLILSLTLSLHLSGFFFFCAIVRMLLALLWPCNRPVFLCTLLSYHLSKLRQAGNKVLNTDLREEQDSLAFQIWIANFAIALQLFATKAFSGRSRQELCTNSVLPSAYIGRCLLREHPNCHGTS